MNEYAVVALAGIGLLSLLCQWLAWWIKLPAILPLLIVGIVAGPVTGWLDPDILLGDLLFPVISLAVAVILFEGSLTLRFEEIRGLKLVVRNLVTFGAILGGAITAAATWLLLDFSFELSLLFGAVMVVTGPTVVIPMLRTVRPNAPVANILRWEGIVIDPLGALLAVLVFDAIISSQDGDAWGHTLSVFFKIVLIGLLVGAVFGYLLGEVLRRYWLPEYLHNVATLAAVFGAFALSDTLQSEAGLLTVTVMGMWLANMKNVPVKDILHFKESLSVLLISALFILLAARIDFAQFQALGWGALGVFIAIQFIARPANVMLSTLGSSLKWQERVLIAWIGPRGIVAAAISALFALRLQSAGYEDAALLVPLTFMIIIGTVVLQSTTARPLARWLGVVEPEPRGLLLIGANAVARTIAAALKDRGIHTVVADANWENIQKARMQGLQTYYGNPISEHADRHLDLIGIGRVVGLSPQGDLNVLAGLRYRAEFGKNAVFALQTSAEKTASDKHRVATHQRGYTLFGNGTSYAQLASLISQGAGIRSTQLSESFTFENYLARNKRAIPMFAISPKGRLHIFTAEKQVRPETGWTVLGLIAPEKADGN